MRMGLSRCFSFVVLTPLSMATIASAQMEATGLAQSDEAEAHVERVIKAAQEIHLDEKPNLDLQPKSHSPDGGWYLGGQLVNLTGGDGRPGGGVVNPVPKCYAGRR